MRKYATKTFLQYALSIVLLVLISLPAFSQEEEEPAPADPKAKARIDAARAAYITERLGLTSDEAEKFWPVYREFADKRQHIRQQFKAAQKKRQG